MKTRLERTARVTAPPLTAAQVHILRTLHQGGSLVSLFSTKAIEHVYLLNRQRVEEGDVRALEDTLLATVQAQGLRWEYGLKPAGLEALVAWDAAHPREDT